MSVETSQTENKVKKEWKTPGQNIQDLCSNYKRCNMHVIGILEGQEWEKGREEIFEVTKFKIFQN